MKTWIIAFTLIIIAAGLGYTAFAQTSITRAHHNRSIIEPTAMGNSQQNKSAQVAHKTAKSSKTASPPSIDLSDLRLLDKSARLADQGNREIKKGDWPQAERIYREALDIWTLNPTALYGMGECAEHAGNIAIAIQYYRPAIYTNDPRMGGTVAGDGYNTNDARRLMEYVLLLSKNGQTTEARAVYHRTLGLVNYMDGKQNVDALLPDFGTIKSVSMLHQMEAMAHIAIALSMEGRDDKIAVMHLQKAVTLAPNSPLPYFYRGQHQQGYMGNSQGALTDYATARRLGEDQVDAGIDKMTQMLPDYIKTANGISLNNGGTH